MKSSCQKVMNVKDDVWELPLDGRPGRLKSIRSTGVGEVWRLDSQDRTKSGVGEGDTEPRVKSLRGEGRWEPQNF